MYKIYGNKVQLLIEATNIVIFNIKVLKLLYFLYNNEPNFPNMLDVI